MEEKGVDKEAIANFEVKAQTYAKKILSDFKAYEFYVGASMDPDAILDTSDSIRVILLNYREDQVTPYITIWKDGLVPYKV
ncbi:hypothetical protein Golomagni_03968 [Golovinomyces magnicellulatus]|nr:hypothetical protein Golomagni_03968 [Golovinomyces magnicellulatus]